MLAGQHFDEIYPVNSDDLLPSVSPVIIMGALCIVSTFGIALQLATTIKYDVKVKTPATVRPVGEIRLAQTGMDGKIGEILVIENQYVREGDVIARIDESQLQSRKSQLQDSIQQNQRQVNNIASQITQLELQTSYEELVIENTVRVSEEEYQNALRNYQNQQVITQATVEEAKAALAYAQEELNRYQELAGSGAIATLQIKEKEQALKTAEARLKKAQAEENPSDATVIIAMSNIEREIQRGKASLAILAKERQELMRTQLEITKQIQQDKLELKQLEKDWQKTVVRAPLSGTILSLNLRNPGQIVTSGTVVAQIVPENSPLLVKARVPVDEISKIAVCHTKSIGDCEEGKVKMKISAYPFPDYGVLEGAVRSVSPDTMSDSNSTKGDLQNVAIAPNAYYEVTIEPKQLAMNRHGVSYPIQAGMKVDADIIAQEDTVMRFFLRKARLVADV